MVEAAVLAVLQRMHHLHSHSAYSHPALESEETPKDPNSHMATELEGLTAWLMPLLPTWKGSPHQMEHVNVPWNALQGYVPSQRLLIYMVTSTRVLI